MPEYLFAFSLPVAGLPLLPHSYALKAFLSFLSLSPHARRNRSHRGSVPVCARGPTLVIVFHVSPSVLLSFFSCARLSFPRPRALSLSFSLHHSPQGSMNHVRLSLSHSLPDNRLRRPFIVVVAVHALCVPRRTHQLFSCENFWTVFSLLPSSTLFSLHHFVLSPSLLSLPLSLCLASSSSTCVYDACGYRAVN